MFPLHDDIPPRSTPFLTYGIIATCTIAFLIQLAAGDRNKELVEQWGMVPARVVNDAAGDRELLRDDVAVVVDNYRQVAQVREFKRPLLPSVPGDLLTLVTCIFLHGGWLHFLGNMWFLHIFGDNVEDRFGHVMYLLLYIGGGVLASLAQLAADPTSTIPTIGASGAIAAVMGAYVMLYPRAVIETVIPLPILFMSFPVPAPAFLGIWFVMQLYNGAASLAGNSEGVAWWAHAGGFAIGFLAAATLNTIHWLSPPVPQSERHRQGFLGL